MVFRRRKLKLTTDRLLLRAPVHSDFRAWVKLRSDNRDFLTPWDPVWSKDHLTRKSFTNRVYWSNRAITTGTALPLFVFWAETNTLVGAVTLDNIRYGPMQTGTLGYWMGQEHTRQGIMSEAIGTVVDHAFHALDLSRIEAACLPENNASRGLLESSGFKYEGVAQSYLQINGRWRTHVLYAMLRHDRRGKTEAGSD